MSVTRYGIIRREIMAESKDDMSYKESKELLGLDHYAISSGRSVVSVTRKTYSTVDGVSKYSLGVLRQFLEARSVNDVSGIVFHEGKKVIEFAQNNSEAVKRSEFINGLKEWMSAKEKTL